MSNKIIIKLNLFKKNIKFIKSFKFKKKTLFKFDILNISKEITK